MISRTFPEIWPLVKHLTLLNRHKAGLVHDLLLHSPRGGDAAECGVFRGGIVAMMAMSLQDIDQRVWAFDSFQGLPDKRSDKETSHYQPGHMVHSEEALRHTLESLGVSDKVRVAPGWYEDALRGDLPLLSLVHVDSDLYESTKICIDRLYERLLPGGFMIFDDYFDMGGGVASAVNEHVARTNERLYAGYCDQVFFVKNRFWETETDLHQNWHPPGHKVGVRTLNNIVIDASIPCGDPTYLFDLNQGGINPELPGKTLADSRRIARQILTAYDFHQQVLRTRQ